MNLISGFNNFKIWLGKVTDKLGLIGFTDLFSKILSTNRALRVHQEEERHPTPRSGSRGSPLTTTTTGTPDNWDN